MSVREFIIQNYTFLFVMTIFGFMMASSYRGKINAHNRRFMLLATLAVLDCVLNNIHGYCLQQEHVTVGSFFVATVLFFVRSNLIYGFFLVVIRERKGVEKRTWGIPVLLVAVTALLTFAKDGARLSELTAEQVYFPMRLTAGFCWLIYITSAVTIALLRWRRKTMHLEACVLVAIAGFAVFNVVTDFVWPELQTDTGATVSISLFAYYLFFCVRGYVKAHEDIRDSYLNERILLLERDELTGLYSKQAFYQHATELIKKNPREEYGIVAIDIANFKYANQHYGEVKCNELLQYLAKCILKQFPTGICGRIGGDQFAAIYERKARISAEQMNEVTVQMMKLAPIPGQTIKFGIYTPIDPKMPIVRCCDYAFMALSRVKKTYGKNVEFFHDELKESLSKEQQILDGMEKALEEHQFRVYYQPKHDSFTGKLVGAEALVRWIHPDYGFMSPGDFIPMFERNGFICKLDSYVLHQVVSDFQMWKEHNIQMVPVSINFSRKDFYEPEWIERHIQVMKDSGLDTSYFHLEVTESAYSGDESIIKEKIKLLRDEGFVIEMDDFGAGYSSLGTLATYPLDIIKLDISFVKNIEVTSVMVEAIVNLAHRMGYKTTAEGVETSRELLVMQNFGCDYIQGYYFSKPLSGADYMNYLMTEHPFEYVKDASAVEMKYCT